MYFVYFLYLSNRNIYKGMTGRDINERFIEHQKGKVSSTKAYLPVTLLGYEAYQLKSDAERREKFLKTTEGRRLLHRQYRDMIDKLARP